MLHMVQSIVDMNNGICVNCEKTIRWKEMKICSRCRLRSFCSKRCQEEDWCGGHEQKCQHYHSAFDIQLVGRVPYPTDSKSQKAKLHLMINIALVQPKLFHENKTEILKQVELLNLPASECIAVFDLFKCPHSVRIIRRDEWFEGKEDQISYVESELSSDRISCVYVCSAFHDACGALVFALYKVFDLPNMTRELKTQVP